MSDVFNLSRDARIQMALTHLALMVEGGPKNLTLEAIATAAASWTTDDMHLFGDEEPNNDYRWLLAHLIQIVQPMIEDEGGDGE